MKSKWSGVIVAAAAALGLAGNAFAADAAAGKARFEACTDCHEPADFKGQPAASIQASIRDIVAGKVKHKGKVKLTDAEAADIGAYLASVK